jgi:hypothetical protein
MLFPAAVALDPLSGNAFRNLASYLLSAALPDEAGSAVDNAIEQNPHARPTQFQSRQGAQYQMQCDEGL